MSSSRSGPRDGARGWRRSSCSLAAPLAAQETVVTGISTDKIALTANFDGSELFVFGAIRRDAPPRRRRAARHHHHHQGPAPLGDGAPQGAPLRGLGQRGVGQGQAGAELLRHRHHPAARGAARPRPSGCATRSAWTRRCAGSAAASSDASTFTRALVRLREANGSYAVLDGAVSLAEETLFQTRIDMPANLVEGDYAAEFFLIRGRKVISTGATTISVEKTGIERWLYNLSRQQPLAYGLLSVALALFAGWLAAAAFALARR